MKTTLNQICLTLLIVLLTIFMAQQSTEAGLPASHTPFSTFADTPAFAIPFVISPNGFYNSWGISFGIHAGATKGIDASLGEIEYPPFPPGGACMLFMTVDGHSILDLRPYLNAAQADTYTVGISTDTFSYPITFSWADVHSFYSGSVRLKSDISGSLFDIDMKGRTSYTLTSGPYYHENGGPPPSGITPPLVMYIIAEGPLTGTTMPVITTYGVGNGGFQANVFAPSGATSSQNSAFNTAAGTTTVWFEYGSTKSYGTLTTHQFVTNGTNVDVTEPFDPSSLPLNTRIHFRAVAQNSLGTFYGGDRVVSNGTPPPEPSDSSGLVMYRTATYRDWAGAKDFSGKRKAVKNKAIRDTLKVRLVVPSSTSLFTDVELDFGKAGDLLWSLWIDSTGEYETLCYAGTNMVGKHDHQDWVIHLTCPETQKPPKPGDTLLFVYTGPAGLHNTLSYHWTVAGENSHSGLTGSLPKKPIVHGDTLMQFPLLPMPNLHNVGEDIYGGVRQSPVNITVGVNDDPKGAHTVYHPKYNDIIKSFVKENKGGGLYHTAAPHWLNHFDFGKKQSITKRQKSLPPDKHNNILFAEQLTLKLNVAASDSGIFPKGLGDLIYSNSTPFDGMSIRQIITEVDSFLGRPPEPPEIVTDSSIYLKIIHDIDTAFDGPMDTLAWSGGKVICTGVRMLKDVPYLSAPPSATPGVTLSHDGSSPAAHQPGKFRLDQNWPNPFNPITTISFTIPEDALITIKVYNSIGQTVTTLADQELFTSGYNEVEFDGSRLASGVYFYRVQANRPGDRAALFSGVRKMLLIK